MDANDIKTRVFRTFGDDAEVQINVDDVYRWINDAQREIAIAADLLETKMTGATSDRFLELPDGVLTIRAIVENEGSPGHQILEQVSLDKGLEIASADSQGQYSGPPVYWVFDRNIYKAPLPADSILELTIYFTNTPTLVDVLNAVLDLPENYHGRILEYCMKQAYELDENFEAMALKGAEYDKNIQTQVNQESWQSTKLYPFINISGE